MLSIKENFTNDSFEATLLDGAFKFFEEARKEGGCCALNSAYTLELTAIALALLTPFSTIGKVMGYTVTCCLREAGDALVNGLLTELYALISAVVFPFFLLIGGCYPSLLGIDLSWDRDISELEDARHVAEDQRQTAENRRQEAETRLEEMQEELQAVQEQFQQLLQERDTVAAMLQQIQSGEQQQNIQEELALLRAADMQNQQTIEQLQEQNESLLGQIGQLQAQNILAHQDLHPLEERLEALQKELDELREERALSPGRIISALPSLAAGGSVAALRPMPIPADTKEALIARVEKYNESLNTMKRAFEIKRLLDILAAFKAIHNGKGDGESVVFDAETRRELLEREYVERAPRNLGELASLTMGSLETYKQGLASDEVSIQASLEEANETIASWSGMIQANRSRIEPLYGRLRAERPEGFLVGDIRRMVQGL